MSVKGLPASRRLSIELAKPSDLSVARKRLAVIKPLLELERRTDEDVRLVAKAQGVDTATVYRWLKAYESRRLLTDLVPGRSGRRMPGRLAPEVEAVIAAVIKAIYLTKQKASGEAVVIEVHRRCRSAGLERPSATAIRRRLRAIDPKEALARREGRKAARDRYAAVKSEFPGADGPLAVVQIDHTLLDIIVVDEEMRLPIGRPWLTLAIDVWSRMVYGYHLSLDAPSSFAVGLALCHGLLDKADELARRGVKGVWPVCGKPAVIHSDNGKDFRSHLIADTLDQYGIRAEFRPPLTPHYGGHIERLAGTLSRKVHALPGSTFASPGQRGEYDAEAKARMTLRALQDWLVNLIVGVYHNRAHDGIGCSPLARWTQGMAGRTPAGPGLPDSNIDARRLRIDFLPFSERTVQPEGIVWDKIWYRDPFLSQWVRAEDGRRRRKFRVRRDPTDISKLYFLDPALGDYIEIPYRDYGRPSISLWDYRAVETWLRRLGRRAETEAAIFDAYDEMHRITVEAAKTTERARRDLARRNERGRHREALTVDPPAQPRSKGHLAVVVDNSGDDFDISPEEINSGVEEWS